MSAFGLEGFATVAAADVEVELYTSAYRLTGTIHTPFRRVAEILNQLPGGYLAVEDTTVTEHAAAARPLRAASALIAVEEILVLLAPSLAGEPRAEMRIEKRPVRATLAMDRLRLEGTIHVPQGSRPIDGLVNVPDRFLPMTDARLTSEMYPALDRAVPVLALRRDRAHVIVVEDERDAEAESAVGGHGVGVAGAEAEPTELG